MRIGWELSEAGAPEIVAKELALVIVAVLLASGSNPDVGWAEPSPLVGSVRDYQKIGASR